MRHRFHEINYAEPGDIEHLEEQDHRNREDELDNDSLIDDERSAVDLSPSAGTPTQNTANEEPLDERLGDIEGRVELAMYPAMNQEELDGLLSKAENGEGIVIENKDISGLRIRNHDLRNVTFRNVSGRNMKWENVFLHNCAMEGFDATELRGEGVTIEYSDIGRSIFSDSKFTNSTIQKNDIDESIWNRASLSYSTFSHNDVTHSAMNHVRMEGCTVENNHYIHSIMNDLTVESSLSLSDNFICDCAAESMSWKSSGLKLNKIVDSDIKKMDIKDCGVANDLYVKGCEIDDIKTEGTQFDDLLIRGCRTEERTDINISEKEINGERPQSEIKPEHVRSIESRREVPDTSIIV